MIGAAVSMGISDGGDGWQQEIHRILSQLRRLEVQRLYYPA